MKRKIKRTLILLVALALVFVLATLCAAATWLLPSRAQRP